MSQRTIDKKSRRTKFAPVFVIKPSRLTGQTRMQEEACVRWSKEHFKHVMEECVNGRLKPLNFEEAYRSAYNLQIHKHGVWVLDEAMEAVRRLNLKPLPDARYFELTRAVSDIAMFPNKVAAAHDLETTAQAAERLRRVRGLELWRLLISKWAAGLGRVDLWKERIAQWRVAFCMVTMRPEKSGAELAKEHFLSLASRNDGKQ